MILASEQSIFDYCGANFAPWKIGQSIKKASCCGEGKCRNSSSGWNMREEFQPGDVSTSPPKPRAGQLLRAHPVDEAASRGWRSGRKTQGSAQARSVFRAPQEGIPSAPATESPGIFGFRDFFATFSGGTRSGKMGLPLSIPLKLSIWFVLVVTFPSGTAS